MVRGKVSTKAKNWAKNPTTNPIKNPIIFESILGDLQTIKMDLVVIKQKLRHHEKLIYFLLALIASLFVKLVVFA